MEPLTREEVDAINRMTHTMSPEVTAEAIAKLRQGPEAFNPFIRGILNAQ